MYRPEEWKNPHDEPYRGMAGEAERQEARYQHKRERIAYEAGADAMLEGLRKQTPEDWKKQDLDKCIYVFIPEGE